MNWRLFATLVLAFMLGSAVAVVVNAADSDAAQMRACLEDNFQACNNEDIEQLMDTQARSLPRNEMAQFRKEAEQLFADTDVYLRLEEFQVVKKQLPFAAVRVVQVTLPADESIRDNPDACQRFYRNITMLMPEHERVEYIQTFKRENGKWRLWEIVTKPTPVEKGGDRQNMRAVSNCPNGQCRVRSSSANSVFR